MANTEQPDSSGSSRGDPPGKTRTWWHPLLARLLDFALASAYTVREEVLVRRIMEELTRTGHFVLLHYMVQQVKQFHAWGEEFAMQHLHSENLKQVEEELVTALLESVPAERRLRGLPPEERLRGLSLEDRLAGISEEDAARLRALLERKQSR